jgi:PelA/Pel-15E family pectate lyase
MPLLITLLLELFAPPQAQVSWNRVLDQQPAWYGTADARAIADSVLAWQLDTGAWPKNVDMTAPPEAGRKPDARESTIDNGATVTQIRFLGRVAVATTDDRYATAVRKGIAYLLEAQYPNGGWPQYFPLRPGYYTRITYNDNAMANVMMLLWDVADGGAQLPPFDDGIRRRARRAVEKGLDVILKTQIRVEGKLTAWCQQHDEVTLEPRPARTFEPIALVSSESVGLVRVLMRVEQPAPPIIDAIDSAVAWLTRVRIRGTPPRWARFYQIGTNRPIFSGRDSIIRYSVDEIEAERRNGYSWYGNYAQSLIEREYPQWRQRVRPRRRRN